MYHGYTFRVKLPPSYDEISKCSLSWDSAENIYNCMHGVKTCRMYKMCMVPHS